MEAYTDLVTSTFQASLAVLLVAGAGYLFSGTDSNISKLVRLRLCGDVWVQLIDEGLLGVTAVEQEVVASMLRVYDSGDF